LPQFVEVARIHCGFLEVHSDATIRCPLHTIYKRAAARDLEPFARYRDAGKQLGLQREIVGFALCGWLQAYRQVEVHDGPERGSELLSLWSQDGLINDPGSKSTPTS